MKQNLPHVGNSCWLNSLFILLSHTDVKSDDETITNLLNYVNKKENSLPLNEIIDSIKKIYSKYNISYQFQNGRQMIRKFYDLLRFENSQFEIEEDYEKISLDKKIIILDYEQVKNMIEYNYEEIIKHSKTAENKIISDFNNVNENYNFTHLDVIQYNNNKYIPCIFSVCLCAHYITLVNTIKGLIIYDDLNHPMIIDNQDRIKAILNQIRNIEFIGYIKE